MNDDYDWGVTDIPESSKKGGRVALIAVSVLVAVVVIGMVIALVVLA